MPATQAQLISAMQLHTQTFTGLDKERESWFIHWREISDYYSPRKYPWLMSQKESKTANRRNRKLLDSVSTRAIRTLASGMMDGITSPARPWFSLRIPGFTDDTMSHEAKVWLQEVERRMLMILSESNFYNVIANLYFNWACFGTAAMMVYEDFDDVVRFYNYAVGEFFIAQDNTQRVNRLGRRFTWKVHQVVAEFGIENVSDKVAEAHKAGGARLYEEVDMRHLVEPNNVDDGLLDAPAPYREVYFEATATDGKYSRIKPFYTWPIVAPRWEIFGNDSYGTSPAFDALPDVQQLQELLREKTIGLAKQISPALIVDQQLRNRPTALQANGITYAATANGNFGAKEAYKINTPLQEIANDVIDLRSSIKETCFNDLFNMFSNLDTVRSAAEIGELKGEKLVHLGPVYQRFEGEVLDPTLKRVYAIASSKGVFLDPPEELVGAQIDVQYVSVLSDAQRAVGTVSIERFLAFAGDIAGVYPEVRNVPNPEELIREYAEAIGVKPGGLNSRARSAEMTAQQAEAAQLQQQAELGKTVSEGAKNLSDTDVGGGQNALSALLG
jgi:hypothetical protein